MLVKKVFYSLVVLSFVSCGSDDDDSGQIEGNSFSLGGNQYNIVENNGLASESGNVSGTGAFVALAPLGSTEEGGHYIIEGKLFSGSYVELSSNSTNRAASGVGIRFTNSGGELQVALVGNGASTDVTTSFSGRSPTDLSYRVEVHNDETPAHILVWPGDATSYTEETALLNSEEGISTPGNGSGSFWSIKMNNSSVTSLTREDEKFSEE